MVWFPPPPVIYFALFKGAPRQLKIWQSFYITLFPLTSLTHLFPWKFFLGISTDNGTNFILRYSFDIQKFNFCTFTNLNLLKHKESLGKTGNLSKYLLFLNKNSEYFILIIKVKHQVVRGYSEIVSFIFMQFILIYFWIVLRASRDKSLHVLKSQCTLHGVYFTNM